MAKMKFKAPVSKIIPDDTEIVLNVFEYEVKESKSSEHPYINWTMLVPEGEFEDQKIWHITSFNPKATFALVGLLDAVGAEYTIDEAGEVEFDTDDVVGQQVRVIVGVKNYQGKDSNFIKKFLPLEGDAE